MVTYKVKMTMAAITSKESEVIAFQTILFCHGVGYKIGSKMGTTFAGCNEKARRGSPILEKTKHLGWCDSRYGSKAGRYAFPVFKRITR